MSRTTLEGRKSHGMLIVETQRAMVHSYFDAPLLILSEKCYFVTNARSWLPYFCWPKVMKRTRGSRNKEGQKTTRVALVVANTAQHHSVTIRRRPKTTRITNARSSKLHLSGSDIEYTGLNASRLSEIKFSLTTLSPTHNGHNRKISHSGC